MIPRADRANPESRIIDAIKEAIKLDERDEPEAALQLLTPLLAEFPAEPKIHVYIAWYLRRCGRFAEAIEHARYAVRFLPKSSIASLVLFHSLWIAGNRDAAIEEIRRFLPIRRSTKHTTEYVDILRRWEAGDRGFHVAHAEQPKIN